MLAGKSCGGSRPRLIVTNIHSDVILPCPEGEYFLRAEAVAPREIWDVQEGDTLVTPISIPDHIKSYAHDVLRLRTDDVTYLTPRRRSAYLPDDIRTDRSLSSTLRMWSGTHPQLELHPFVFDRATLDMALHLGLSIAHGVRWDATDARWRSILELIYKFNLKSACRDLCEELALPIAPGSFVENPKNLVSSAEPLVEAYGAVVIKRDRGSNSFENCLVRRSDGDWRARLRTLVAALPPASRVVEVYYPGRWFPVVEYNVTETGPLLCYRCEDRHLDQTWVGTSMPWDLSIEMATVFTNASYRVAIALHDRGYRGPVSIEGIVTAERRWVITELNLRRSGGTFLHRLLARFVGPHRLVDHFGYAGSLPVSQCPPFQELLARAVAMGLAATLDRPEGIIFTVDGTKTDQKIRYALISTSPNRISDIRTSINTTLLRSLAPR